MFARWSARWSRLEAPKAGGLERGLHRHRTGNLTTFVATDTVGHQKDHYVVALDQVTAGVFIALAIGADMGEYRQVVRAGAFGDGARRLHGRL